MFIPALGMTCSEAELVGWTAFLPGTHVIERAADVLSGLAEVEPLEPRLQGAGFVYL